MAITRFRMAELPGTLKVMFPSAFVAPTCGAPTCTLLHAIREGPLFDTQRHTWVERLSLRRLPQFGDAELLRWIFFPRTSILTSCRTIILLSMLIYTMWHPSVRSRDPCVKACRCDSLDFYREAIDLTRNTRLSLVVGFAGQCTWRSSLVYILTVNIKDRTSSATGELC